MLNSLPGISVIICCYNSATRLPKTLLHLTSQEFKHPINWEIIVVNNASTDNTLEITKQIAEKFEVFNNRLIVVNQPIPGLSHARDMGIATAKYKYVIFCDDDNWLESKYLNNAYHILEKNPRIGALGGQGMATTDAPELPEWFDKHKSGYAVGKQAEYNGDVSNHYAIWGAGLVTRKELYLKCFPKEYPSFLTGRKGSKLSAGEDTEFCLRLLLKGYMLYYDDSLQFTHFIPKERLTLEYRDRLHEGFEVAMDRLSMYSQLFEMMRTNLFGKFILFSKKLLGYLSTFFGRKSSKFKNVQISTYYLFKIDIGAGPEVKKVYSFYKDYHFTLVE